ncbi:MAG: tetratricopeptide repeat protein, partial [Bacteroidota bacterium]|nr:tetratricopeptide repeat protein [Bacteroidota bacterium]
MKKYIFLLIVFFPLFGIAQDTNTLVVVSGQEASLKYNQGLQSFSEKKYDEAISYFSEAIKLDPNFEKAYYNRGSVRLEMKEYEGAILDFEKAIMINPSLEKAFFSKAYAELNKGLYEEAVYDFNAAIQLSYSEANVYYYKGVALFQLNKYDEAEAAFSEAINKNEEYVYAYNDRAATRRMIGKYIDAEQDYNKAIALDNNQHAFIYNNRGTLKRDFLKNFDDAIADYSLALSVEPNYVIALNNRGRARYLNGDFSEVFNKRYTEYGIEDINNDETDELLIIRLDKIEGKSS